jgi:hypothetical protein
VSLVHDAIQTVLNGQSRRTLPPAAAILCCLALLSGCGSSAQSSTLAEHSSADVGESVRSDTCAQWRAGTIEQRRGTLVRLRKFAGSPVGSSAGLQNGHVLSDDRAYKLLQSFCAKHFARAFKLYKLYERAAAFVGH